ncbi:10503_t:CDS:2 [Funneliformis mosseae]|uniref:10503_t:CDS:1 n=1 Tax=Funneliformis mosseae TaxID=27381 RepID=A0A9N9BKR2_FUNMO|nr:10503_t:CDS:2 [Funneliformis mosseae]
MTNVLERYLRISTFQHLEVFQINYINIKAINYMIEGTGGRLKQIFIKDLLIFSYDLYDESLKLIRIVRETCPLIENLSLVFIQPSDKHLIELEKLLRTCQNLKVLILEMDDNSNDKDQGTYEERKLAWGEKLLNVLVRSAPSNLSVIGILNEFKFSINTLGEFLENWKGRPDNGVIKEFRHSNVDSIMDNYGL